MNLDMTVPRHQCEHWNNSPKAAQDTNSCLLLPLQSTEVPPAGPALLRAVLGEKWTARSNSIPLHERTATGLPIQLLKRPSGSRKDTGERTT